MVKLSVSDLFLYLQSLSAVVLEVFESAVWLAAREHSENLISVTLDVDELLSDSHQHIILVSRLVSEPTRSLLVLALNLAPESVEDRNSHDKLTSGLISISHFELSIDSLS